MLPVVHDCVSTWYLAVSSWPPPFHYHHQQSIEMILLDLDSEMTGVYRNVEVKFPLVHERGDAKPRTPIYAQIKLSAATSCQYLNSPIHTRSLAIMTPALIRLHLKPGELSTSTLAREAEAMQIQSTLSSRSTNSSNGVGENTVIFIVLGVGWSCSFSVLCWFVRRCAPYDTWSRLHWTPSSMYAPEMSEKSPRFTMNLLLATFYMSSRAPSLKASRSTTKVIWLTLLAPRSLLTRDPDWLLLRESPTCRVQRCPESPKFAPATFTYHPLPSSSLRT